MKIDFSFIFPDLIACRMWITITWFYFPSNSKSQNESMQIMCHHFHYVSIYLKQFTSLFDGYLNNIIKLKCVYHSQLMRRAHSSFYQCFKILFMIPLRNPSPMDSVRTYLSNIVHQAKPWIHIIFLTVRTALSMSIGNCHHCEYKIQSATSSFIELHTNVCNDNFLHFEPLNCVLESSHSYRNGLFYTTQI